MPTDILTQAEAQQRAALVDDVAYDVAVSLSDDPGVTTYRSVTKVSFNAARAGEPLFLDLIAATVESITVNGKAIPLAAFADNRIRLDTLQAGPNLVEVVANANYMSNGVGLHRKVDPNDGRVYMYTHFEPFDAHKVYACFDQPDIKARFTLAIEAPDSWTLISNQGWEYPDAQNPSRGATTQTTAIGGGRSRTQFAPTKPIPPYLTNITAGDYYLRVDSHRGLPLFLAGRQSQRDVLNRNATWMLDITKEGLDLFKAAFGFDYQFAQYGQIFVPEFNAGAMENPGAVLFNDDFIPKGKIGKSQQWRLGEVTLHEMAHVYGFGDVTTMTWWDDLHLNETFATFMSYLLLSRTKDFVDDAWLQFAQAEKSQALAQDQLPTTHPVKSSVTTTEEVSQLFDQITYAKGACVIRQLYALLGDEPFFRGLREYFKAHWFGNATQADFLDSLGKAAGRDLQPWGQQWMGTAWVNMLKPTIKAGRDGRMTGLTIVQSATAKYPTLRTHHIGIGLYDLDPAGKLTRRSSLETDIQGARTDIQNPLIQGQKRPALIVVNDGDLTYAKVRFDAVSLQTLRDHIGDITDPLTRTVCWTAIWDMVRDAEFPAYQYVDMVAKHARNETAIIVLDRLLTQAHLAANTWCAETNAAGARAQLATVSRAAMEAARPGSDVQLSWLRSYIAASETAAQLDDVTALLDGTRPLTGIDVSSDADLRWQAVLRLATAGRADAIRIRAEYDRDPSDVAQRREIAALAGRPTAAAKLEAWKSIIDNPNLPLATVRALCRGELVGGRFAGGFNQPGQEKLIEPYVSAYMAAVPKIWATREENVAESITLMLYPRYAISEDTVRDASKLLRRKLPYSIDRLLREARDGTQRALRARRADLGRAGGPADGVAA